jgi:hypothetical protein
MTAIRFFVILLLTTAVLAQGPEIRQDLPSFIKQPLGLSHRVDGVDRQAEPSHGDLINQGLTAIRGASLDYYTNAKKRELAGYIPAGQEATVVFMYSVRKIRQGEDQVVKMFDDVYPSSVKVLQESSYTRRIEYEQEEVRIQGTGAKLKQGAPALPTVSKNDQLNWIAWSQWRDQSSNWETKHKTETTMRAKPEPVMREAGEPAPQLDPAFIAQNQKLLGLTTEELRKRPDAQLAGVAEVLKAMDARATGPSWSPQPGGILLSPEAAGKLGDGLTIDRVEYVPGTGQVKVTGNASVMGLDADILATTLRIAFTSTEIPYFSLDPHEPWDDAWEASHQKVSGEVSDRLRDDPDFAAAFQRYGFDVTDINGHVQRLAYLDQIDPALAAEVSRRAPMNMDLVFHPKWLKRTRLGEMLFIADQSIKELWRGAQVWSMGPSRALRVDTHIAPKFWSEPDRAREELAQMLNRTIDTTSLTRWWFTPGGPVAESGNVLDLSQVQPILQTERIGGTGTATWNLDLGNGRTITQQIVLDPYASLLTPKEDAWSKAVVEEVNLHFDAYAKEFPEWEALRQVFRAYVFAIWLVKHDPAMGQRLLAQLPSPRPPSKPLPAFWPDPQILVVRKSDSGGFELGETGIIGGVGFENNLLRSSPASGSKAMSASMGTVSNFPGVEGFTPNPIDDDVPATPEGYAAWKASLLKQRGFLWEWVRACLTMAELWTLLGISFALALASSVYTRWKAKQPLTAFEAGAISIDTLTTALVFMLLVLHPDTFKDHTAPFTAFWTAVISYSVVFMLARRQGRLGIFSMAMVVVFIWTAFTPGLGEMWRGFQPLHLAMPPLDAYQGAPLPTDVVYTLQGLTDGLTLGRAAEPRYAFYPLLVLLLAVCFWFEVKAEKSAIYSARTVPSNPGE